LAHPIPPQQYRKLLHRTNNWDLKGNFRDQIVLEVYQPNPQ